MSLDAIQMNAKTIIELYRLHANLQNQNDKQSTDKAKQIRNSILSLAYNIQRMINEERQNAG